MHLISIMEKEYYMNAGIPTHGLLEPAMQSWNSFSLPQQLNCTSQLNSSCLLNPNWDKPNDHFTQFQSTLSSVVSSSALPTSSALNDFVGIRELIVKSGHISNSGRNPPPFAQASNLHTYAKLQGGPILNEFGKENLPNFSTDPEFAKRAAMFSCFGSHSFTARRSYSTLSDAESTHRSNGAMARVWSSPSLKQGGSPVENKNSLKTQMEINNLDRFPSIDPNSNESSSISEQVPSGETMSKVANEINTRKRKAVPKCKAKENVSPTVDCHKDGEADDDAKNGKRARTEEASPSEKGGINRQWKEEEEEEKPKDGYGAALDEQHKPVKVTEKAIEPPKDYIHVRARRGQATDSHSLAERVRREKIGERMKFLQDLVPGCNKVTGKALMLDEIINYVQSLQCQVEFLSMKLASVDPRQEVNMDNFTSKDIMQRNGSLYPVVDSSVSGLYSRQANQYPPVHTNASLSQSPMDPVHKTSSNNHELQLPSLNEFIDCFPQFPAFLGEDLQSIVGMGFSQDDMKEAAFHSMSFPVANQLQRSP